MMEFFRFVQVNFWPLMMLCALVAAVGIVLIVVGKLMQWRGESLMRQHHEDYLYPPVEDYDPVPDYRRRA